VRKPAILLAILFAALLGAIAAAPVLVEPPTLRVHNGPGQFDARRAKARLSYVLGDQRPHPADSAADDQVRSRLIQLLRQMGLKPIVRDQFACNELFKERGVSCARVRNLIAIVGQPRGKALLINAHYDSVPVGPGASDDGIGVATLLEVGSILKDRPLRRPVILLFNEGEELGLVGARAFLADPLSKSVDSLVNLEARGVNGPVNMFETSRPNGTAVTLFASAVKRPSANSLSTDVYELMPNYTDVNSFSERQWLTLNLAPIGNETRYHSAGDNVAALDPSTLQHMGDQTLALAEALASGTPAPSRASRIFMDLCGRLLIMIPLPIGVALLAGLLLAFAAMVISGGAAARAAVVVLGTLFGSAALSWLALAAIGTVRPGMFWRAQPVWTLLSTYADVLLVGTVLIATVGRAASLRQLRNMFWLLFVGIGALIGFFAPGGIIFFLLPPLVVLIGTGLSRWSDKAASIAAALGILLLYLTWGAMLGLLEELLNGGPMWVFAPLGSLLLLPALIEGKPLVEAARARPATLVAALFVLAGSAAALAAPTYSEDRKQRFTIEHVTEAATGKSWWSILNDGAPLPASFGHGWKLGKLPIGSNSSWIESAPADPSARAPQVHLISQVRNGSERTLLVALFANGNDEVELVAPADAKIRTAGIEPFVRPIDQNEQGKFFLGCSGRSCNAVKLELTTGQAGPLNLLIIGRSDRLPSSAALLVHSRPALARPQYIPDSSLVFARVNL
jgi:hypothetical protein